MSRKSARKHAFILIYQKEFHKEFDLEEARELYFEDIYEIAELNIESINENDKLFMEKEIRGTLNNLEFIDNIISKYALDWELERISKIDLAIMRLSIHELGFLTDIPTQVSINEAVELAKSFGDDSSSSFINGLLGNAVIELRGQNEN